MNGKKTYQAPHAEIIRLDMEQMIATSGINSIGYTEEKVDNNTEALAGNHRGSWGNLWN